MAKKRVNRTVMTKNYATSSTSRSNESGSSSTTKSELSVSDKLSRLRLEGLRHERNVAGPIRAAPQGSSAGGTVVGDPEIASILGHEYVEPVSRAKVRSRGHLAPRSWNEPVRRQAVSKSVCHQKAFWSHGVPSLVQIALTVVKSDIPGFANCGMNFLPGYLKASLLSSLPSDSNNEAAWHDIVPFDEEQDDLTQLDLSQSRATLTNLKGLIDLRVAKMSLSQLHTGLVFGLPSVLQNLTIVVTSDQLMSQPAATRAQANWRKLSSHFIALRLLTVDLLQTGSCHDEVPIQDLLHMVINSPDWRESFDTVKQVSIMLPRSSKRPELTMMCQKQIEAEIKAYRRLGKHVEVHVSRGTVGDT